MGDIKKAIETEKIAFKISNNYAFKLNLEKFKSALNKPESNRIPSPNDDKPKPIQEAKTLGEIIEMIKTGEEILGNKRIDDLIRKEFENNNFSTTAAKEAWVYSILGEHYFNENQYGPAIKYFQKLPGDPNQFEDILVRNYAFRARIFLAFSFHHINNKQNGKKVLDKTFAEAYDNKRYMAMAQFAYWCIMHNLYIKEALPWAEKASEICEKYNYTVISTYGKLAGMNNEYDKAIDVWKNLLKINPENDVAYKTWDGFKFRASANLAAVYLKSGDLQKGDNLFQKLLKESSNSPDRLMRLAETCYFYKIKSKEALSWSKKSIELSNGRSNLNTHAKLLYDNGFIQEAIDVQTKAIEQSPDYNPYQVNLRKYKSALN